MLMGSGEEVMIGDYILPFGIGRDKLTIDNCYCRQLNCSLHKSTVDTEITVSNIDVLLKYKATLSTWRFS